MRELTHSLIMVCLLSSLSAAEWYSSPSATLTGNGSSANPWKLELALQTNIAAGDTLYLMAGTYVGPFVSTLTGESNALITVTRYGSERVVLTDGGTGLLLTNAAADDNSFYTAVSGSEFWPATAIIQAGSEQLYPSSKTGTNYHFQRGWAGTTPIEHTSNEVVYPIADILTQNGSHVVFKGFEITSVMTTNRIVGTGRNIGTGLNMTTLGHGNKAINLTIYNVGHPGIGFWQQGEGGEVNGCLLWGNGMYDNDGAWIRGSGIYSQNQGGMAQIKNIITFRNLTFGAKVFGETGPVKDFGFYQNIAFSNGDFHQLESSSGSTATSNIWFVGNTILGRLLLIYESTGNSHQYVISNTIVGASLQTKEHHDSVYTNNTIFNMKNVVVSELTTSENGYRSTILASNQLNIVWDYNTWFTGDGSSLNAWNFETTDVDSGWLYFNQWQAASGFDAHSTVATNWPTDYLTVSVQPLDYDPNRWHICVVNTTTATNASIDLSTIGFSGGQRYSLRDAQNYFVELTNAIYTSGNITLPLWKTNVSEIPGVTNFVNKHTNVDEPGLFNAFVLNREITFGRLQATTVRAGRIGPPL